MNDIHKRIADLPPEKQVALLERLHAKTDASKDAPIKRQSRKINIFSASFAQQRLWFLDQLQPGSTAYLVLTARRFSGPLDMHALQQSLQVLVHRHESLRTTLQMREGQPVQVIHPASCLVVPVIDLQDLEQERREVAVRRLARQEREHPCDLEQGPLLRIAVVRLENQEHVLLLTLHHIITDGWSNQVLVRELSTLYQAHVCGQSCSLPPLPIQYADYALWQRQWLQGEVLEAQLAYWRKQLADLVPLALPTDHPRPAVQSYQGTVQSQLLPQAVSEGIQALSRQQNVTVFMTLVTAFEVLLARYSGQRDIAVGTPIANRNYAQIEGVIGFFVNTLVLRCDLSDNPTFVQLLGRVREVCLGAYAHQDIPFEKVVEALEPERDLSRSPLFQAMFVLQNAPREQQAWAGVRIIPLPVESTTSKFDLALSVSETEQGLSCALQYRTDLFEAETIRRLLGHWQTLLQGILANPQAHLSDLPLLTTQEREQLLVEWNATQTDYPRDLCVHQLFEQQVERTPDAVALVFEEETLTYDALNCRVNQLAYYLQGLGVAPEVPVGLCVVRSLEMVIGLLGILKAGGVYVPLDPEGPVERLGWLLQDAQVHLVLTQVCFAERLSGQKSVVSLDQGWQTIAQGSTCNPRSQTSAQNLAYVVYTSGSTGVPKGVSVTHRAIVRLVKGNSYAHLDASEVFLQLAPLSFDAATLEVWASLLNGAKLVIYPAQSPSLTQLSWGLQQYQISTLWLTAGLFHLMIEEHLPVLARVRQVLAGGDVLSVPHVNKLLQARQDGCLINGYGPTENTTFTCCYSMRASQQVASSVSIGCPIANTTVYVLDSHMHPVPVGITGELYIGGDGLARCYLSHPDLTAERFLPHPLSTQPGERLYQTGDLVRYLPDGTIEFVGRMDSQVKIRGYRVELGEIEAVLGQHPAIQNAVVLAREDESGEKRLMSYPVVKQGQRLTVSDVRTYLQDRLPGYMVPSAFVFLDSLPLTPNGKVDRRALPAAHQSQNGESGALGPRTPIEDLLVGLWSEVLGRKQVGISENFFELGGHSLLATRLVARVRTTLGVEVPLRALFEAPTVAELAHRVEQALRQDEGMHVPPLVAGERPEPIPLSFAQQRLWFLDQLQPGSTAYLIPRAQRFLGELYIHALEQSLQGLVHRHESLRTTFAMRAGQPMQVIHPASRLVVPVVDLQGLLLEHREKQARHLARQEREHPCDLEQGPLLRIAVVRLENQEHVLLLTLHHIITDGWSNQVLMRELSTLYRAHVCGQPCSLPPLPIQYADYALWQRQWLQGEVLEAQLAYWRKQLADLAPLALPTDHPRPAVQSYRGTVQSQLLPQAVSEGVQALSRQQNVTVFMTLLAAFEVLLARYSGQRDIAVGTPIANRTHAQIEGVIGFFVNTLVLRCDLSDNPTFVQLLGRVREVCLGAYAHQDIPFEKVVEELEPERDLSRSPLFQVMFILQNAPREQADLAEVSVRPLGVESTTSKFDLALSIFETKQGLSCALQYCTDLFEAETIRYLLGHWQTLLQGILANPQAHLSDLPLLTTQEREQLLVEWNATQTDYPRDLCVHQLFEQQAEHTPDAVAVVFEEEALTYAHLNRRANQLAHYLQSLGVGPEVLVGICMPRCIEMVIGLLGVLKAGGAYLPLDSTDPAERLAFLVQDAHVPVLLKWHEEEHIAPSASHRSINLPEIWSSLQYQPERVPESSVQPENMAYVIYTSGSTGIPKGVVISHMALLNLLNWHQQTYQVTSADRGTQVANLAFDAAVWEVWPYLVAGASLVLVDQEHRSSPSQLIEWMAERGVTLSFLPTPLAEQVLRESWLAQPPLRALLTGGDKLHALAVPEFPCKLINHYGPTESTVVTTCAPVMPEVTKDPPIGQPIANIAVYVLDQQMHLVPIGVTGELSIAGRGLARGYLNRPDLTAERFVPHPWSQEPGARLYQTGDLVRSRSDGNLEFVGRKDRQIKLRGYRIELGEIEALLALHPAIQEAVVQLREDILADKRLVAYLVMHQGQRLMVSDVRTYLQDRLPGYMVPSAFVFLDALPLTPNGKVDRGALPAVHQSQDGESGALGPRTPIEDLLVGLWSEVLGRKQVGISENFFELGGHSLLATQLIAQVRRMLGVEVPLRALFEAPTVAELAHRVEQALRQDEGMHVPPLVAGERPEPIPLSFAQQRLWFLDQLQPGSTAYLVPTARRFSGPLNMHALQQSLEALVHRHEGLRTTLQMREGQPVQVIHPASCLVVPVIDLQDLEQERREVEVQQLARQEREHPCDLEQGPLLRIAVVRLENQEHVLLLTLHHIITDGWSNQVLMRELSTLYQAHVCGQPCSLPPLPIQYADYALWQRQWLQGEVLEAQLAYWRKQLADIAPLALPTDHPRPAVQSYRGAVQSHLVPQAVSEGVQALSRQQNVTVFMTLVAAFEVLLACYSGQRDIAVGTPIANRTHAQIEGVIGFFVNTLVLRCDLSDNPTFVQLLGRVREVCLGAYAHQDIPFEKVVEALQPERDLSRSPLFQVMFTLQNAPREQQAWAGMRITPLAVEGTTSKFDLILRLDETEQGLHSTLRYNTDLFEAETIRRLLGHWQTLLQGILANPQAHLSDLPLLTENERTQLLLEWNATQMDYPEDVRCMHQIFEQQAEHTPDAVAVVFEDEALTYTHLNRRANQLAHYLQSLGVGLEVLVGICMERCIEMVLGLLAVLKAGGAYVPLDSSYPDERLAFMIADAGVSVLLTHQRLQRSLPALAAQVIVVEQVWERLACEPSQNPTSTVSPENLAYVIYTSGSTGVPKGVLVAHSNVHRLFTMTQAWFQFQAQDVWTLFHSSAFDFSVWEMWGALLHGGRLVVVPYWVSRSPDAFSRLLTEQQVTVLNQTPSAFRLVMQVEEADQTLQDLALRLVIFGGEALDLQSLHPWVSRHGDQQPRLINMYGITETTVHVTSRSLCRADLMTGAGSLIGRAIPDLQLYILDAHQRLVPIGVPGELYVGGRGLARGYWQHPELTAQRFIPHPWGQQLGARLYRTGDLVRYHSDGDLEYLGRVDHQVKIRGYRIELGEIEATLMRHPAIQDCVVLAREDMPGEKRLVAYPVLKQTQTATIGNLRTYLHDRLPVYMIPSAFVPLDALPLTPNGKVDRRALPAPEQTRQSTPRTFVAPRTVLEECLACMWQDMLHVEQISVYDSFFEIGGESIKAILFINKLQERLGMIIHVATIFDVPTVAGLADYLAKRHRDALEQVFGAGAHLYPEMMPRTREPITETKLAHIRSLIPPLSPVSSECKRPVKNPSAIFVLSPPRSGSTLLRVMLAGHPRLFAPPELELLSFNTLKERHEAYSGRNSFWLEGTMRALMEIKGWDVDTAREFMDDCETHNMVTKAFYALIQQEMGERMLVEKTPAYALDRAILQRAEEDFEQARYIHLLRHPYGMIHSFEEAALDQVFFRYPHPFETRELAELVWLLSHQNIEEFLRAIPADRHIQVRFEELVERPAQVMEQLATFLHIEFHPAMLQPYTGQRMTDGIYAPSKMLGDIKFHQHKAIDAAVAHRWREAVTEDFLGEITWQMAQTLGYHREMPGPGKEAQEKSMLSLDKKLAQIPRLPREGQQEFPLSFAQQRFWFLDQLQPESTAYLIPKAERVRGDLCLEALEQSLQGLVHRHESLRTTFAMRAGQPMQVIHPASHLVVPVVDLQGLLLEHREGQARQLARQERERPCDLEKGPLLRTTVLQLENQEHVLLLTLHHIIADGWSMEVLMRELTTLYRANVVGKSSPLAPLPIQYADYALWQRQWLQGEILETQLTYWRKQLANVRSLGLPTDHPHPAMQTSRGASQSLQLSLTLYEELIALSQQQDVTLFMLLLATFQVLLMRYTGQADVCVGTLIANRTRAEFEDMIGLLINALVMRIDLSDNPPFQQALQRVRKVCLQAYAYQDIPFEYLIKELQPERDPSRPPLFQVLFQLHQVTASSQLTPELKLEPIRVDGAQANYDLEFVMVETQQGLHCIAGYNTDLFEAQTIRCLLGHWQTLLQGILANPQAHVSDLPLLTTQEREQLLVEWNATQTDYPQEVCVHQLFGQQAECTPDAVALVFEEETLTYDMLNRRANQLAHYLQELGIRPYELVGICMERSIEMVIGLLAILKAGGAYVPLDPAYPAERLAYMLEDMQSAVVLTQQSVSLTLPTASAQFLCLDTDEQCWRQKPSTNPLSPLLTPEDLAYVIYTSGSTGRPKGTGVYHRSLVNLLNWFLNEFHITSQDRALIVTSFSFDLTQKDILAPLLVGGAVHLLSLGYDVSLVRQCILERGITLVNCTPSMFYPLVDGGQDATFESLMSLRWVLLGGEPLSLQPLCTWMHAPQCHAHIVNTYGPTECTDVVAFYRIGQPDHYEEAVVPIGRPISNTQLFVLDEKLQVVPPLVAGELYVAGICVGAGYVHDKQLTATKFLPNPFAEVSSKLLYKTGDLARIRADGAIEYLGRTDRQVKLRGYRIELGEIEAVLRQHPAIQDAVVLAREDIPADKHLVAYAVMHQGQKLILSDVRSYLQDHLPGYMIPSAFVSLDALPLTPNGKVDRRALPVPEESHRLSSTIDSDGTVRPSIPPRDAIEWQLVQIWEEVLQIQPVSILDDFFDLGGHSLLAVRLMSQIDMHFERHLSLATIFEHPTVAELAVVLRQQISSEERSPLVAIQPHGSRPVFFCVHPAGGTAFCYVNLAWCLGHDQPFYGLHASDPRRAEGTPKTIEEMAAAYLAAIQAVQPQGPYLLGGWSLGGVVALEMAQQLQRQGHEVGLLAVMDSSFASSQAREKALQEEIDLGDRWIARALMNHCQIPVPDDFDQREPNEQFSYAAEQAKKRHFFPADTSLEFVHHYGRTFLLHQHMMRLYVPQKYQQHIDYFAACGSVEQAVLQGKGEGLAEMPEFQARLQPWCELAQGGLEVHPVPGGHMSFVVEEPYVQVLAEALKQCLDRVCERLADAKALS